MATNGELIFIGLGLHDELGLSLRGLEVAKSCAILFAEFYTSLMPGLNEDHLNELVGSKVKVLSRSDLEERAEQTILEQAKTSRVGLLVPGDPMVATTHVDLRLRASKAGIRTRIIHSASVLTATTGVTGLQSYKFGRTVTIPAFTSSELPDSIYATIRGNRNVGMHSLILLEIDSENNRYITIPLAIKQITDYSSRIGDSIITVGSLAIGVARLEAPDMTVKAGTFSDLCKQDFGGPPYVIVLPGKLHFMEAEALMEFCGARKELVDS